MPDLCEDEALPFAGPARLPQSESTPDIGPGAGTGGFIATSLGAVAHPNDNISHRAKPLVSPQRAPGAAKSNGLNRQLHFASANGAGFGP